MDNLYTKLKGQETPEQKELQQAIDRLNEYQKAAVLDNSRVLLLNAQVGSGKTTVLTNKVLYLHFVRGVPLESMVVLTFTNKAALEIKERIRERNTCIKDEELKFFGTFHSVCRSLLASVLPVTELGYTSGFSVYDPEMMQELYERVMNDNNLSLKYKNKIRKRIEKFGQGKLLYGNMKHDDDLAEFIRLLEAEKKRCDAMEFDDLIENTIELLGGAEFSPLWIIIDEFQDCDERQLELIKRMRKEGTRIFAVGDPNQVIYTWRGSKKDIFSEFRNAYGGNELTLPINYRSTATILDAARAFIDQDQPIRGIRAEGRPIVIKKHHNTFNEALYLCDRIARLKENGFRYDDIAVLYRKQKQSEVFRDVFEQKGVPYQLTTKRTLRDIPVLYWLVRLLKAAVNNRDKDSLIYVMTDRRYGPGLAKKQVNKILSEMMDKDHSGIELIERIIGFEKWCIDTASKEAEDIFAYFDLSSCLMPTSITYSEDRSRVMSLLGDMIGYGKGEGEDFFLRMKNWLNTAALYGSYITEDKSRETDDSVRLMTLHASKGLEFRCVFISAANLGLIPIPARGPEDEEEEKRLFFVGITRAKDFLEISYHTNPDEYGVYGIPSPYLRMIPPELIESEDFVSRGANLSELRREIKANMDMKAGGPELHEPTVKPAGAARVYHEKYGQGIVVSEDASNISVEFDTYGVRVFSKAFCPLKYLD